MILDAHGLRVELPRGWSGRLFARAHDVATLHAGSFPVALRDGEFGDHSTALMPHEASFLALTEYRPGGGLAPGHGLFASRRLPRRLDPSTFSVSGLAHPRPGQAGMQHFFTARGRPFCLYVVIAGRGTTRRHQLAVLDHVLGTVKIASREPRAGATT
jgi:hypothetical protein